MVMIREMLASNGWQKHVDIIWTFSATGQHLVSNDLKQFVSVPLVQAKMREPGKV